MGKNKEPYWYKTAMQLKDRYKTKEELIKQEKEEHYNYLNEMKYCLFNDEDIKEYLNNLSSCNTWEEIEEIYNKRPFNRELR